MFREESPTTPIEICKQKNDFFSANTNVSNSITEFCYWRNKNERKTDKWKFSERKLRWRPAKLIKLRWIFQHKQKQYGKRQTGWNIGQSTGLLSELFHFDIDEKNRERKLTTARHDIKLCQPEPSQRVHNCKTLAKRRMKTKRILKKILVTCGQTQFIGNRAKWKRNRRRKEWAETKNLFRLMKIG